MTLKRILIAEDDHSIQLLEKRILESAGYEVDCTDSGDTALEMVKSTRYLLVVADVMMPGMDGFQLTKEINRLFHRGLPVLLVTAVQDALDAAHDQNAKPFSSLQKPFTATTLLTAVRLLEAQVTKGEKGKSQKSEADEEETKKKQTGPADKKKSWLDRLFHPADG